MKAKDRSPESRQAPWLEYSLEHGGRLQRTMLGAEPVTIGRSENADIQIDSPKVSREHARISCQNGAFFVEDLGSTNGTCVNGQSVERAALEDGDVVLVADVEFAFFAQTTDQLRHMATQQMPDVLRPHRSSDPLRVERDNWDAVLSLRAAQQQLLAGTLQPALWKIEEHLSPLPYALLERPPRTARAGSVTPSLTLAPPQRTQCRLREASRWEAWSRYSSNSPAQRLMVTVESWEIGANSGLLAHFEDLQQHSDGPDSIVAVVHANEAVDLPEVTEFCHRLQEIGVGIACDGFLGGHAHIKQFDALKPQTLILSPQLTNDLLTQPKCSERLAAIADACRKRHIQPAAERLGDAHSRTLCLIQGIRLFLGEAQPAATAVEEKAAEPAALAPALA